MSLIKKLYDAASVVCKSTALKAGAAVIAATMIGGCFKRYFSGYWPPDAGQAQLLLTSDGITGARVQPNFAGENSSANVDLSHSEDKTTIKATGNKIKETESVADVNLRPSNNRGFYVRPVIALTSRTVETSAGQKESDLESTLLAADLKWAWGLDNSNKLIAKVYGQDSTEEIPVAGNITMTQRGVYLESRLGMFLPLLSYESNEIDFGSSVTNITEVQLGTSLWMQSAGGNVMGAVGGYVVLADDGKDQTTKIIVPGNLELGYNWGVLGFDGIYDGDLASLGIHGCIGGDSTTENVKALSTFIRNLQASNYLIRGIPKSSVRNQRFDLSRNLEQSLDNTKVFYFVGGRQQHNAKGDVETAPYAYVGVPIHTKGGKKIHIGLTYGPFLVFFPEDDVVKKRKGLLCNAQLNDRVKFFGYLEGIDYASREDKTRVVLGLLIPIR